MESKPLSYKKLKALLFDVFGTVVDWRTTVTNELNKQAEVVLYLSDCTIPQSTRLKASEMTLDDWGQFAQDWRDSYIKFTRAVATDPTTFSKNVDQHFHDSLTELLDAWSITRLWGPKKLEEISRVWHRLEPWPDSVDGIKRFNEHVATCTLSNGNVDLLQNMAAHASLEWTHVFSADMFNTYKPDPKTYLGAAEKAGAAPSQCAMVAAHLYDLKAAHDCGLKTIYVERPREESFDAEQVAAAKRENYIDLWIKVDNGGFLAVAESLAQG